MPWDMVIREYQSWPDDVLICRGKRQNIFLNPKANSFNFKILSGNRLGNKFQNYLQATVNCVRAVLNWPMQNNSIYKTYF